MPHKRKTHGDAKKHGGDTSPLELHHNRPSAFCPVSGFHYSKSQPSRTTPGPAAQVSAAKPAQSEKESAMASKPGVVTRATAGATGSGTTAGGSAPTGTAGKVTAKAKTETNTTLAGATVIDMSSAGSAVVDMAPAGVAMPKTAPTTQGKATVPSPTAPGGKAAGVSVTEPKDTAKSTAAATVKAEVPKVDPAKKPKPATVAAATAASAQGNVSVQEKKDEAKPSHTKVEGPPTAAQAKKEAPEDPFDTLASFLPSADPVAPQQPVFTGPEVTEHGLIAEKGHRCGEREDTLPPGYRFEDMGPVPADAKSKDSPKPMTTDQALDSLSFGFTTDTQSKTKEDHVDSISASSAGPTNFAPPPVKKTQAPPADKKAKTEKVSDDFSLAALLPSAPTKEAAAAAVHPPADKKPKLEKVSDFSLEAVLDTKVDTKPKTATDASMSLDALSALCDTLPEDAPKPESPKLRPEDIVSEDKLKKEKGVRVGERDDTLPPDYRFNEEELKKLPAPKPEPSMSSGDALDILSGGFMSSSAAPAVQAPAPTPPVTAATSSTTASAPAVQVEVLVEDVSALNTLAADFASPSKAPGVQASAPVPSAPSTQKSGVPRPAVCPPAPSRPQIASGDFSLEGALSASTAKKVESSAVPPATDKQDRKDKTGQDASMSLDALSALCDTLPEDAPKPESPKLRPEDIVSEDKLKKEKGVRVGERDDTLPPDYRFNEEELKKLTAPKPEPSMSSGDALDILSGGFMSSSAAPAVQAPAPTPPVTAATSSTTASAPAVQVEVLVEEVSALNTLAADFASPSKAPGVQASAPPPTQRTPKVTVCPLEERNTVDVLNPSQSIPFDALSALSETLADDTPRPESPKLRAEDMVSEDKLKKEKGVRVGERDDTLPPDYRFNEEELKKLPAPKPEPSMSSGDALDILSGGFMSSSAAPAVQAPAPTPPVTAATSSTTASAPAVQVEVLVEDVSALNTLAADFASPSKAPGVQASAPVPSAPSTQPSADFALDALASDFVASTAAPAVKSACVPMETTPQLAAGADGTLDPLDLLSDTLKDIKPIPQPAPAEPKNVVEEKKVVEEKLIKMGERDDTLPPEYRPTEEDRKVTEGEKKKAEAPKETMDDKTALDLLSSDFSIPPAAHQKPATPESEAQKPMAGPVLQSLSDTLLPDAMGKPKKQQAEEPSAANLPSVKTSSDVVAASATKGRKS